MGNSSSSGDDGSAPAQPSMYSQLKEGYDQLVNSIIRPPRCFYDVHQLGPSDFEFMGNQFHRSDFECFNKRQMKIMCSHWQPLASQRRSKALPCVIYMHGNASGRIECINILSLVLSLGATVLAFDFCGSGLSDGEYVSLGSFEKDDLDAIICHLREAGTTSTIALWGRSMGAATALLHGERDPSIAAMILDSSFSSLTTLAEELVEKGREQGHFAPSLLVSIALRWIRSSVQQRANFDIYDLNPIEKAEMCFIPALFVAATGDNFVPMHHSQKIHDKYAGDKNLILVGGGHSDRRPRFLFDSAGIFLTNTLQIPENWVLPDAQKNVLYPPWHASRSSGTINSVFDMFANMTEGAQFKRETQQVQMQQQQQRSNGSSSNGQNGIVKSSTTTSLLASRSNQQSKNGLEFGTTGMDEQSQLDVQQKIMAVFGNTAEKHVTPHTPGSTTSQEVDEEEDASEIWVCAICTLNNISGVHFCAVCESPRP